MLVGIDVAKAELVVAVRPSAERWSVANDERGVATLVERVRALTPQLIVLEAIGGYELLAVAALASGSSGPSRIGRASISEGDGGQCEAETLGRGKARRPP